MVDTISMVVEGYRGSIRGLTLRTDNTFKSHCYDYQ